MAVAEGSSGGVVVVVVARGVGVVEEGEARGRWDS